MHRDVKPGNLLVTPAGAHEADRPGAGVVFLGRDAGDGPGAEAHRGDAGLSGARGHRSARRTPRRSSDIYSLGCSLYYAVTGKVPFPGGTTSDKLRRHLEEAPLTPARFNPQLDAEFVDLIADMMHKRADQRIQRRAEVVERLRPWTAEADATTWRQIGEYAKTPGELPAAGGPAIADTIPVHAEDRLSRRRVAAGTAIGRLRRRAWRGRRRQGLP